MIASLRAISPMTSLQGIWLLPGLFFFLTLQWILKRNNFLISNKNSTTRRYLQQLTFDAMTRERFPVGHTTRCHVSSRSSGTSTNHSDSISYNRQKDEEYRIDSSHGSSRYNVALSILTCSDVHNFQRQRWKHKLCPPSVAEAIKAFCGTHEIINK